MNFSVSSTRMLIDEHWLGDGVLVYNWNNWVPIKINVFNWKLSMNRLPTRSLLVTRGIIPATMECVNCGFNIETINHVFFSCPMASDLWSLCGRWCGLVIPDFFTWTDWNTWLRELRMTCQKKKLLEAICLVLMWAIWMFRNSTCFAKQKPKKGDLFHNVVLKSFLWISNRCRKFSFVWANWLYNHLM